MSPRTVRIVEALGIVAWYLGWAAAFVLFALVVVYR